MRNYLLITVLLVSIQQGYCRTIESLRDSSLENYSIRAVKEALGDEISQVGVVVLQTNTGNIKAMFNISQNDKGCSIEYDVVRNIRSGTRRAVLFLALLEAGCKASDIFYAPSIYRDDVLGSIVIDKRWKCEGYNRCLPLYRAMDYSDTSILLATEAMFDCNTGDLGVSLRHAGAFLGDEDQTESDYLIRERYKNQRWKGTSILGYHDYVTNLQMAVWLSGVANKGKMLYPRLTARDPYQVIYDSFSSPENLDSLRWALRQSVLDGLSVKANSSLIPVSGLSNISADEYTGKHTATFCGYTEARENVPSYTLCVVVRGGKTVNVDIPCSIAKNIIDWIAGNHLNTSKNRNTTTWKRQRLPRGVD